MGPVKPDVAVVKCGTKVPERALAGAVVAAGFKDGLSKMTFPAAPKLARTKLQKVIETQPKFLQLVQNLVKLDGNLRMSKACFVLAAREIKTADGETGSQTSLSLEP